MKYEPKRRLVIEDPAGDKSELFLRGNMTLGEVMKQLGYPAEKYTAWLDGDPVPANKMLKEIPDIEKHPLVLKKRRRG